MPPPPNYILLFHSIQELTSLFIFYKILLHAILYFLCSKDFRCHRTRDRDLPAVFLECERGDRRKQTPQDWAPNTTFPLGVAEDTASWGRF